MLLKNINFKLESDPIELMKLFNLIKDLDNYYPDFPNWFINKLIPRTFYGYNKVLLMYKNNDLVGVSSFNNHKLQMVRIFPEYINKGYGLFLIDESLKLMNNDKPFLTVAEELINVYSRIFINRYDFTITRVEKGIYRKGKLEYLFNHNEDIRIKTGYL
jgi:hypothetical protein